MATDDTPKKNDSKKQNDKSKPQRVIKKIEYKQIVSGSRSLTRGGGETTTFLIILIVVIWGLSSPNWAAAKAVMTGKPQTYIAPPASSNQRFTALGIVVFGLVLWLAGVSSDQGVRNLVNGFLGVLLLSMILLNWNVIKPLFIAGGGTTNVQGA